jgi:type VI secretion system protein ImpM
MLNESTLSPGFYGKLPILGDFVSRHLPKDFIKPWDDWLQRSIAVSKQELGENWLKTYLTCPIWRFALTPGLCGKNGWMGVIMPSVDRVGRYFPLTIAVPISEHTHCPSLLSLNNDWYLELEKAALTALEDELDLHSLELLLNNISIASVSTLLAKANKNKEHKPFAPYHSLWSIKYSNTIEYNPNSPLVFKGLPPINEFSNLLGYRLFERNEPLMTEKLNNINQQTQLELQKFNQQYSENAVSVETEQLENKYWLSYARTNKGNRRRYNQDAFLNRPDLGLWVIADGMGGHQAGDVASRMIVHKMNALKLTHALYPCIGLVQQCLQQVNQTLRQFANEVFAGQTVGSTVIALLANANHFSYIWAGDSRLYRLRNKKLEQLSVDHSEKNDGLLFSPKKNHAITRAVGAFDELELDSAVVEGRSGDKFLLCSDGLDNEVLFHEIEQMMNNNYQTSVNDLISLTLSREARDNVTVLVVEVL